MNLKAEDRLYSRRGEKKRIERSRSALCKISDPPHLFTTLPLDQQKMGGLREAAGKEEKVTIKGSGISLSPKVGWGGS